MATRVRRLRRHAVAQRQAGQQRRAEAPGDDAIDQHQRRIDRRQQADQRHRAQRQPSTPTSTSASSGRKRMTPRHEGDAADVAGDAGGARTGAGARGRAAGTERPLEGRAPAADQVIAGIAPPRIGVGGSGGCRAASARRAISGSLKLRAARHLLDGGAIEIAGGEIHVGEGAAGAQHVVDRTHRLEELGPVDVGDQPHAGDDVADGDIGGALELVFLAHQFVGGRALARETLLQPADGRRRLRILVAQALDELHGEAFGQRRRARRVPAPRGRRRDRSRPAACRPPASASSRAARRPMIRRADRRRFSTRTMRSEIATAHSSPMVSGWTFW